MSTACPEGRYRHDDSHVRTSARPHVRTSAFLLFASLVTLQLGCSEQGVAETDVDHGYGAVVPATVVDDPKVMGGKVATLDVTTASLDGIRADLANLFGGVFANAELIVNPEFHMGLPGSLGCSPGKQHVCLEAVDGNDPEDVASLGVRPFNPAVSLVEGNNPRLAPGGLQFLTTNPNAVTDLSFDPNGAIAPDGLGATLAMILPDRDDIRIKVEVDSAHAAIENRGSQTGLWVPVTLEVEDPAGRHHHCNDTGTGQVVGTLPPALCSRIVHAAEGYGCQSVELTFKLNRIHLYFGFIPTKTPACDPYGQDPAKQWMQNVPLGRDFDQPCLTVKPAVQVALGASKSDEGGDVEVGVHVNTDFCDQDVQIACATVVDCDDEATTGALPQVAQQIPQIAQNVNKLVGPYLSSNGAPFADPAAPQCDFMNVDAQKSDCLTSLMAASVAEISYGWFANPFTDRSHQGRHYPIVNVDGSNDCPPFYTLVTNDYGRARCVDCFDACPVGGGKYDSTSGLCSCVAYPNVASPIVLSPSTALHFDYAVDTDGDTIPNLDDDCPDTPNQAQLDADQDGIGDECDPCPCDPDPNATDPDHDGFCQVCDATLGGICASLCAKGPDNCPLVENESQANCNRYAEDELGLKHRGDACDPVPCPDARAQRNWFLNKFSTCNDPSDTTGCALRANVGIDWYGVQDSNPTNLSGFGTTEFAHCNCAGSYDEAGRVQACKTVPGTNTALCSVGNHQSFPAADGFAGDGSHWVSASTQLVGQHCLLTGDCPIEPHALVTSGYRLDTVQADERIAAWRFDQDLGLLLQPGAAQPTSETELAGASADFNGLGWAHTRTLGTTDLGSVPLPDANRADATYSDAASHYFIQDPDVHLDIQLPKPQCPPGSNCGFSSFPDLMCIECLNQRLPTWLLDRGNQIVQMGGGSIIDVTDRIDGTLIAMLRDPSLTVVQASEPASILRAQSNGLRAFALNKATFEIAGYVAESGRGLFGVRDLGTHGDPPTAPVLTASAIEERVFGVTDEASGERLVVVSADAEPNAVLPISGIDIAATPRALAYRAEDRQLYLVDEQRRAWSGWLRLVRISPDTGAATVLARTPYFRRHDAIYLSADNAGELMLAASASRSGSTLFMTLAPTDDDVRLTGWLVKRGTLLAPPDTRGETGYSVVMRKRRNGPVDALEIAGKSFHRARRPRRLPPWCD